MHKVASAHVDVSRSPVLLAKIDKENVLSPVLKAVNSKSSADTTNLKDVNGSSELYKENNTFHDSSTKQSCVNTSFGKAPHVGYSSIQKQMYRKANRKGFNFNFIIVGGGGLGKSTFLNSLFLADIYNDVHKGPSIRFRQDKACKSISTANFELVEDNVKLSMTVIDTPGFAESLDNSACWQPIIDEIDRRNEMFMRAEGSLNRKTSGSGSSGRLGVTPDPLIHACLYFIASNGHGLRLVDKESMKHLSKKVNVIPVIAKADTMTADECKTFKATIREELQQEGVATYDFPVSALLTATSTATTRPPTKENASLQEAKLLRQRQPFAVCTGNQEVVREDGKKVRCRIYPWGVVETDSLEHNDFQALKILLMQHYMQDLIDVTHTTRYNNFRFERLSAAMEASNFSVQDGRDPLCILEIEKRAHQCKLEKLVQEMDSVYLEKVRDREDRLKTTEGEMLEQIECMRSQLESDAEDLAIARQKFNDERISWEMANREYVDSVLGSCEKLEKMKKRRGLF